MKITQKDFVNVMTNNLSTFIGITKKLYTADEIYCKIQDFFDPKLVLEKRIAKKYSNFLVFSNESRLDLTNRDFYKYSYPEGDVYICVENWFDEFDNINRCKCMYYLVNH